MWQSSGEGSVRVETRVYASASLSGDEQLARCCQTFHLHVAHVISGTSEGQVLKSRDYSAECVRFLGGGEWGGCS